MSAFPIMPFSVPPSVDATWELITTTTSKTYPATIEDGDLAIILETSHDGGSSRNYASVDGVLVQHDYNESGGCSTNDETSQAPDYHYQRVAWKEVGVSDRNNSLGGNQEDATIAIFRRTPAASVGTIDVVGVGTAYEDDSNENRNYTADASGEDDPCFFLFAKTQRGSSLNTGTVTLEGEATSNIMDSDHSALRVWLYYPAPEVVIPAGDVAITQSGFDSSKASDYRLFSVRS